MSAAVVLILQRVLIWALVVQQLLAGAGARLPLGTTAKSGGERYPCEACGCGCLSAEHCWRQCCCFTNQQKVAWAKGHGVAVPEFVVEAAEQEAAATKPRCPHCVSAATARDDRVAKQGGSPDDRPRDAEDRGPQRTLCWLDAMNCRGAASYWQAALVSLPLDVPRRPDRVPFPVRGIALESYLKDSLSPPTPPTPPPEAV